MIYALCVFFSVLMLVVFIKSGSFPKAVLTSAVGGIGALFAVKAVALFIPVSLGVNFYSLAVSALFSVPGVILMLLSQTFLS